MGMRKNWRKKFNSGIGKYSLKRRQEVRQFEQKVHKYAKLRNIRLPPYQTVRRYHVIDGKPTLRFTVKRLHRKHFSKVLRWNHSGTKISVIQHQTPNAEGFRIIDLNSLSEFISSLSTHFLECRKRAEGEPPLSPMVEKSRCGLSSTLQMSCNGCHAIFQFTTSKTLPDSSIPEVNMRGVWGSVSTGGGISHLNELLATLGIPGLRPEQYSSIETSIGDSWNGLLQKDMCEAAAEEKRLAIERNDFHDGVPAITVICDGGWSKRSHRHTYNALGGVAVIIGAATGKLLHLGVRNKYCYVCTVAESQQCQPKIHRCFKNWTSSSQAMETDVIVDGFQQAEKRYGLRYMRFIGDGDSSVHANIIEKVPVWGRNVTKLECANHACKCLRSSLERLLEEKPFYKGKGKLTKQVIVRLTKGVRCAIMMRSKEGDRITAIKKLRHDINNSVNHVFGLHNNCSDFCKKKTDTVKETLDLPPDLSTEDTSQVIQNQQSLWEDVTRDDDMEEYRCHFTKPAGMENIDPDLLRDVTVLLNRLSSKSDRLMGNFTTNLAESWMSVRCKFDGGKLVNRCNKGSWQSRCYGGALRKNFGPAWSPIVWHKVTGIRPGPSFTSHYKQRANHLFRSIKSKQKPEVKMRAHKRRQTSTRQSYSKRARKEYGEEVLDVVPDMSPGELDKKCNNFLSTTIYISDVKMMETERDTRSQSCSQHWIEMRKQRLTSSVFGEIVSRSTKTQVGPLIKRLLYSSFCGNRYTRKGLHQEGITIKEYVQLQKDRNIDVNVTSSGLVIDKDHPYLGCSPDGVVIENREKGLIEIKNLLQTTQISFQAAAKNRNFCLDLINGKLKLKTKHKYFYQCQGLLNICKMPWIDFIVRRTDPYQIHIERIKRDDKLWSDRMVPKLHAFYIKCLLPELYSPRHKTSTGIREPEKPWFDPTPGTSTSTLVISQKKVHHRSKFVKSHPLKGHSTLDRPQCTETQPNDPTQSISNLPTSTGRPLRRRKSKFVGRRISHQWYTDDTTRNSKWYEGDVLECVQGRDGQPGAVYEVKYKGYKELHNIEHLQEDFDCGKVKFIDI